MNRFALLLSALLALALSSCLIDPASLDDEWLGFSSSSETLVPVPESAVSSSSVSSSSVSSSSVSSSSALAELNPVLLADWCFDDIASPFADCTGRGHDAVVGEGIPEVEGGLLLLDGKSGLKVKLAEDFRRNDFIVEARVWFEDYGEINNLVAAYPPGRRYDGWTLSVENRKLHFEVRDDNWARDWYEFFADEPTVGVWTLVKAERRGPLTTLWVDGLVVGQGSIEGDIGDLRYDLGIGYDPMNMAEHNRYFTGKIDYVRYYGIE